jgi:hypothetical protein
MFKSMGLGNLEQEARSGMQALLDKLDCLDTDLQALLCQQSYEYGRPVKDTYGYDPRRLPSIQRVQPDASKSAEINFSAQLGKAAVRGHISNIGANDAKIVFIRESATTSGITESNTYLIKAGTTLDLDGFVDKIRVTATSDGAADVQTYVR